MWAFVLLMESGSSVTFAGGASVVISALTAGFTVATFSYDMDTDKILRKMSPDFYGIIPNGSSRKTLVFACMSLNGALLLLIKSLTSVLLIAIDFRYFVGALCGEIALFMFYKSVRRDFTHPTPLNNRCTSAFVSFFVRLVVMVSTSFTAPVQFRHVDDFGGLYYCLACAGSLVTTFAATYVYFDRRAEEARTTFLEEDEANTLVSVLVAAWVSVFAVFLLSIKRSHLGTFLSVGRGCDFHMNTFLTSSTDEQKASIFGDNPIVWRKIRPLVSEWVKKRWWTWEEEQPEWFTDAFKASVPSDMLPEEEEEKRASESSGRGGRRRSSIARLLPASPGQQKMSARVSLRSVSGRSRYELTKKRAARLRNGSADGEEGNF